MTLLLCLLLIFCGTFKSWAERHVAEDRMQRYQIMPQFVQREHPTALNMRDRI